jgi:pyridoxine kinase
LTVALPILSAAGVDCAILPTAVLSTHTGGFSGYTFRDLTADLLPIVRHWQTLDMEFDAIYAGYLGSMEQLSIVAEIFDVLSSAQTLCVLDPVMGDDGRLYPGFVPEYVGGMRELCRKADVLVPNMTEAALLLETPFHAGPYTREEVAEICRKLGALHGGTVVLTGVFFDDTALGAAVYDAKTGALDFRLGARLPFSMNGTGDVFASALVAGALNGRSLSDAAQIAAGFTARCMEKSAELEKDLRFGPCFEPVLPELMRELGII